MAMSYKNYAEQLQIAPINRGLHYVEYGNGPTLLFLHGALSNGFTFRKVLSGLSNSFHCIALDLPLGGHSIPLSDDAVLSPSGIAGLVAEFIDFKKVKKVHLIANDTGGAYAQIFAASYPEMVASLTLSNCEVKEVFPPAKFVYLRYAVRIPGFTFLMAKLFNIESWLSHPAVMGALSITLTNENIAQGYLYSFVRNRGVRKDFAKACKYWRPRYTLEAARQLQHFQKPVLVLWGEKDVNLFPRKQMEKLLDIFPQAKWETIRDSKTYVQEDAPAQTIQAIQSFIEAIQ